MERPKDRSGHTERIEEIIDDTQENMNEARAFENENAESLSEDEKERIEEKNQHRVASMESMEEAIQDKGKDHE